jgi:hypothetical protein
MDVMRLGFLEDIFRFVVTLVTLGCATGVVVALIKIRGKKASSPEVLARLDEIAAQLGRVDAAIDTMSVEVERISEAQRFTSRLLAERAGAAGAELRPLPGSTTPH